jgi:hypothetical protein
MAAPEQPVQGDDEVRDELPDDLNAAGYVGPYTFPDNARRRIPGVLYLLVAAACVAAWAVAGDGGVFVNDGFLYVAIGLALFGLYCIAAGAPLQVDETEALVSATRTAGFVVGHASAQLGWRGLLSRPTWRILLYSAEEPPRQRGLVLVDGFDGEVLEHFVEANPEDPDDWAELATTPADPAAPPDHAER